MNERLPYEESVKQKLQEIPLPEMEPSWQKMKVLLKEKDDNRVVPPFFSGCAIIGLFVLLIIAGFWFYKNQYSEKNKKVAEVSVNKRPSVNSKNNGEAGLKSASTKVESVIIPNANTNSVTPEISGNILSDRTATTTTNKNFSQKNSSNTSLTHVQIDKKVVKEDVVSNEKINSGRKRKIHSNVNTSIAVSASDKENTTYTINKKLSKRKTVDAKTNMQISVATITDVTSDKIIDSNIQIFDSTIIVSDTNTQTKDTTAIKDTTKPSTPKEKEKKKSKYYFTAGLSLQHVLPLSGQASNNYDAFGRKNSWRDYTPSLYIRFYKEKKWFLHTGFRYGAPQAVKEVLYNTISRLDTSQVTTVSNKTTDRVRRTFYHQIPLSFNYYITPKLSVGAGIMYSVFNGALSQRENMRSFVAFQSRDSIFLSTSELINVSASSDSLFTRTQFNFTLQTEFHWRRFGFGAQYTKGIQPFLKYVEAGELKKVKNESVQLFIRYQLWKQRATKR